MTSFTTRYLVNILFKLTFTKRFQNFEKALVKISVITIIIIIIIIRGRLCRLCLNGNAGKHTYICNHKDAHGRDNHSNHKKTDDGTFPYHYDYGLDYA